MKDLTYIKPLTRHIGEQVMVPGRSVAEILADPQTPAWIVEGVRRLQREDPGYAAFLTALHDMRVGAPMPTAQPRRGPKRARP